MKNKLITILRYLISIEENCGKEQIPTLRKHIDTLDDISLHEDDCQTNLPENMMFGKRWEKYMLNTSELTGVANTIKGIIERLEDGAKPKELVENVRKARFAVKHCIDR